MKVQLIMAQDEKINYRYGMLIYKPYHALDTGNKLLLSANRQGTRRVLK